MISEKFQTWNLHLIPQFSALWGYFLPIWFIGISGSSDGHCPLSALYFSKNKKNGGDDNWNPIRFPFIWFFLMLTISIAFPSMMSMEFSSNLKTSEPTISISCKKINFFFIFYYYLWNQSLTSLKTNLHQDLNWGIERSAPLMLKHILITFVFKNPKLFFLRIISPL